MSGGLSAALKAPGGITAEEACARAEENLQLVAGKAEEVMRDTLSRIVAITAAGRSVNAGARRELHSLSCSIAGMGGMFGRPVLSKVAYNFCRLIDEGEPGWSAEAARVYVGAMQLLMSPDAMPQDSQDKLLAGLLKVRRVVGAK